MTKLVLYLSGPWDYVYTSSTVEISVKTKEASIIDSVDVVNVFVNIVWQQNIS